MVGFCISDDAVCCEASKEEIKRRYGTILENFNNGKATQRELDKITSLLDKAGIRV